ncbi:MAG: metallophosphoesterase [Ignavibacteria bacterium]|jgi:hypothetical protein
MTRVLLFHLLFVLIAFPGTAQYISMDETNNPDEDNSESSSSSDPDFVIVGLPDTQYYSENLGGNDGDISTFIAQTNWIVDSREDENIVYVAHLGDCVENADDEAEWIRAEDAMDNLEDAGTTSLQDGIPYGIAVGNHDQFKDGSAVVEDSTTKLYNKYFGISRFSGRNYYGGHHGNDNDNHFDLFSVGSLNFVVVYIEYNAFEDDQPAVDWANSILESYADRYAILVSHKLLNTQGEFSPDAEYIYSKVRENANLFLMLCGHNTNTPEAKWTESRGGDSLDVITLMSNYQSFNNGGDGWLRVMKFSPSDNKIYVKTYSPTRDAFRTSQSSQFELDFDFPELSLPVELASFTGTLNDDNIQLQWRTETETNNYGFYIERAINDSKWETISFIKGYGNSNSPKDYNYIDYDITRTGNYTYRLKQIDIDGTYEYSNRIHVIKRIPDNFSLSQNYPNPFNPSTRIDFSIPERNLVILRIYNTLGEIVSELVNEIKEPGSYSITFNAQNLASGIYIYQLVAGEYVSASRMLLVK